MWGEQALCASGESIPSQGKPRPSKGPSWWLLASTHPVLGPLCELPWLRQRLGSVR